MTAMPTGRAEQPLPIRITHWINVVVLLLVAGSGLQILDSFPSMGPRGALYSWYPFQGKSPPEALMVGGWLAGARHLHFALAWFLVLNAVVYLAVYFGKGEWRRRLFMPADIGNAVQMALYYVRIRKAPPEQGLYNGLQKLGYTSAVLLGVLEVLSGLAIYKPVQLSFLAALFGGYDGARAVHLLGLVALAGFTLGHVLMVALHPRTFIAIVTGGRRE